MTWSRMRRGRSGTTEAVPHGVLDIRKGLTLGEEGVTAGPGLTASLEGLFHQQGDLCVWQWPPLPGGIIAVGRPGSRTRAVLNVEHPSGFALLELRKARHLTDDDRRNGPCGNVHAFQLAAVRSREGTQRLLGLFHRLSLSLFAGAMSDAEPHQMAGNRRGPHSFSDDPVAVERKIGQA